jgi:hypothetical protein
MTASISHKCQSPRSTTLGLGRDSESAMYQSHFVRSHTQEPIHGPPADMKSVPFLDSRSDDAHLAVGSSQEADYPTLCIPLRNLAVVI